MKSTFLTIAVALFALTCQAQQIEVSGVEYRWRTWSLPVA